MKMKMRRMLAGARDNAANSRVMVRPARLALAALLLALLPPAAAQAAQGAAGAADAAGAAGAADARVLELSGGNADFAARLFRAVAARSDDNVLLAPFALSAGLAALMSGADGATRQQLLQGLGLAHLDAQQVPDLFQSLRSLVTRDGAAPLRQGVGVFPSQRFTVSSPYLNLVQTKYHGNAGSHSYTSPQEAQDIINRWGMEQTGNRVKDLVGPLDPQTQLLLVTAAFYQSQLSFNASFTQDERFYVDRYHIVQVPMMFQSGKFFLAYDPLLKLGVLKLPMSDGTAMLVLLPDENVDITSVEEELTAERVRAWIAQLKKTKLEVQLPRFLLERSYSLRDVLQRLDMSEVFQDGADLSNIAGDKSLKLSEVFQKTVVSVDESGGADGGGASVFSSLPPRLTINRPFLFLIYQEGSGSFLYMGRVVNPTQ